MICFSSLLIILPMKKFANYMYKNQKHLSVSSVIWALLVTAVVLLIAASTNTAAAEIDATESASTSVTTTTPPERRQIEERDIKPNVARPLPSSTKLDQRPTGERKEQMSLDKEDIKTKFQNALQERKASFEERKTMWQEELMKRRSNLEEKRLALASSSVARRAILSEMAQKRISARADKIKEILTSGITKTKGISDRLHTRVIELQARGVDVSVVLANLNEANVLLATAEQALEGIEINTEYTVTSANPRDDLVDVKNQINNVRDLIKEAQSLLRETMKSLKEAIKNTPRTNSTDETEGEPLTEDTTN